MRCYSYIICCCLVLAMAQEITTSPCRNRATALFSEYVRDPSNIMTTQRNHTTKQTLSIEDLHSDREKLCESVSTEEKVAVKAADQNKRECKDLNQASYSKFRELGANSIATPKVFATITAKPRHVFRKFEHSRIFYLLYLLARRKRAISNRNYSPETCDSSMGKYNAYADENRSKKLRPHHAELDGDIVPLLASDRRSKNGRLHSSLQDATCNVGQKRPTQHKDRNANNSFKPALSKQTGNNNSDLIYSSRSSSHMDKNYKEKLSQNDEESCDNSDRSGSVFDIEPGIQSWLDQTHSSHEKPRYTTDTSCIAAKDKTTVVKSESKKQPKLSKTETQFRNFQKARKMFILARSLAKGTNFLLNKAFPRMLRFLANTEMYVHPPVRGTSENACEDNVDEGDAPEEDTGEDYVVVDYDGEEYAAADDCCEDSAEEKAFDTQEPDYIYMDTENEIN